MRLLQSTGVQISGANAVVLGRSDIVGSPVSAMLRNADATVTQCHSKTTNIENIVRVPLSTLIFLASCLPNNYWSRDR
jgi:methylenetetrahydrofolate dehydrogenase (NADP+) / methenyltetrahydrofolate cyclohydrolase / formyltetrahydrofolate synthetase